MGVAGGAVSILDDSAALSKASASKWNLAVNAFSSAFELYRTGFGIEDLLCSFIQVICSLALRYDIQYLHH
jgi:hypothetical protein